MAIVQLSLFDGKVCRVCHQLQPLENFFVRETGKPRNECKACKGVRASQNYYKRHEYYRTKNSEWYRRNRDSQIEKGRVAYYANREQRLRYHREYAAKHRQEANQRAKAWYAANKERVREREGRSRRPPRVCRGAKAGTAEYRANRTAYMRDWYKANPERSRIIRQLAKARRRERLKGKVSRKQWVALCAWFGNVCVACGKDEITLDHVYPVSLGGLNVIENLQPLCKSCNSSKQARYIDYRNPERLAEFLASL